MTYNAYNFTNTTFNESSAESVYWVNSELIIVILLLILACQIFNSGFIFVMFYKRRNS